MGLLSKDFLLGSFAMPSEEIELPDLGGSVRIRGMTGAEREVFEGKLQPDKDGRPRNTKGIRSWVAATCLVNDDSTPMFNNSNGEVESIGKWPARALDKIFAEVMRLSGLTEKEQKDLTEGNS